MALTFSGTFETVYEEEDAYTMALTFSGTTIWLSRTNFATTAMEIKKFEEASKLPDYQHTCLVFMEQVPSFQLLLSTNHLLGSRV